MLMMKHDIKINSNIIDSLHINFLENVHQTSSINMLLKRVQI